MLASLMPLQTQTQKSQQLDPLEGRAESLKVMEKPRFDILKKRLLLLTVFET